MRLWDVSSNRQQFAQPIQFSPVFVTKTMAIQWFSTQIVPDVNWLALYRGLCHALVDFPMSMFASIHLCRGSNRSFHKSNRIKNIFFKWNLWLCISFEINFDKFSSYRGTWEIYFYCQWNWLTNWHESTIQTDWHHWIIFGILTRTKRISINFLYTIVSRWINIPKWWQCRRMDFGICHCRTVSTWVAQITSSISLTIWKSVDRSLDAFKRYLQLNLFPLTVSVATGDTQWTYGANTHTFTTSSRRADNKWMQSTSILIKKT